MRIFSLDTEEQFYSQVKFWWTFVFHLRKRYSNENQSTALNVMKISKIVHLGLSGAKVVLNDVVVLSENP